jgi:hypothetical protein
MLPSICTAGSQPEARVIFFYTVPNYMMKKIYLISDNTFCLRRQYFFLGGLFNDAVSSSDYRTIAS